MLRILTASILLLALALTPFASAASMIENTELSWTISDVHENEHFISHGIEMRQVENRFYVPVRSAANIYYAHVAWDSANRAVLITRADSTTHTLVVGELGSFNYNGTVYAPVTFVHYLFKPRDILWNSNLGFAGVTSMHMIDPLDFEYLYAWSLLLSHMHDTVRHMKHILQATAKGLLEY